jgi:hypothetical protein
MTSKDASGWIGGVLKWRSRKGDRCLDGTLSGER